jgi:hypothetical protein
MAGNGGGLVAGEAGVWVEGGIGGHGWRGGGQGRRLHCGAAKAATDRALVGGGLVRLRLGSSRA